MDISRIADDDSHSLRGQGAPDSAEYDQAILARYVDRVWPEEIMRTEDGDRADSRGW